MKVYSCKRYKLDKSNAKYIIRRDCLLKIEEGDLDPQVLVHSKIGKDKHAGLFKNARNRSFEFTNIGKVPLCVVSGKKTNFLVSPPIKEGSKALIQIKENKNGYLFGVIPAAHYQPQNKHASGNPPTCTKMFVTNMFDSLIANVKSFNIWSEDELKCHAAAIKCDHSESVLPVARTKCYNEEDRFDWDQELKRDVRSLAHTLLLAVKPGATAH